MKNFECIFCDYVDVRRVLGCPSEIDKRFTVQEKPTRYLASNTVFHGSRVFQVIRDLTIGRSYFSSGGGFDSSLQAVTRFVVSCRK